MFSGPSVGGLVQGGTQPALDVVHARTASSW